MGFDGKTLIHPTQVEPCNDAFAPSADEIEYPRRVIEAFEAGIAEGKGVVTVDGRMIENLHVDNARRAIAVRRHARSLRFRRPFIRLPEVGFGWRFTPTGRIAGEFCDNDADADRELHQR